MSTGKNSLSTLKQKNRHSVLQFLRRRGDATVAEIAAHTGLSIMTVHNILDHLRKNGLVRTPGKGGSTEEGGKKPRLFAFNPDCHYIFSVRIVDRFLSCAITDMNGDLSVSHTAYHGNDTSLDDILGMVRESFYDLAKRRDVAPRDCHAVVVGSHGVIDGERGVCVISPHFESWGMNVPIRDRIQELLPPDIPVHIGNWMHYHTYGELMARGAEHSRLYFIGTEYNGLAGGLVIDGRLRFGLAGEIGHMIVERDAPVSCFCGGVGCFEVATSLRRLEARARGLRDKHSESMLFRAELGRPVTYHDIFEAANLGDALACTLVDGLVEHFAVAINNIMYSCDPELIIIQGEYAKAGDYFIDRLRRRVNTITFNRMPKRMRIEYSHLDYKCTLSGAAKYIADSYFDDLETYG